jgi:hypothetical protein
MTDPGGELYLWTGELTDAPRKVSFDQARDWWTKCKAGKPGLHNPVFDVTTDAGRFAELVTSRLVLLVTGNGLTEDGLWAAPDGRLYLWSGALSEPQVRIDFVQAREWWLKFQAHEPYLTPPHFDEHSDAARIVTMVCEAINAKAKEKAPAVAASLQENSIDRNSLDILLSTGPDCDPLWCLPDGRLFLWDGNLADIPRPLNFNEARAWLELYRGANPELTPALFPDDSDAARIVSMVCDAGKAKAKREAAEPSRGGDLIAAENTINQAVGLLQLMDDRNSYCEVMDVGERKDGPFKCGVGLLVRETQEKLLKLRDDCFAGRKALALAGGTEQRQAA